MALRPLYAIRRRPLNSSVHPMTDPSRAHADVANLFTASLAESDPEVADAIGHELARQRDEIELIASENIVSKAVLEAQGSVLTNKYAEGYPGRRYYQGCAPSGSSSPTRGARCATSSRCCTRSTWRPSSR